MLLVPALATAQAPSVELDEALRRAETENPQVQAAEWAVVAARARKWQAVSYYGPTLSVDANHLWWDQEIAVSLAGDEPMDCTAIPPPFDGLCVGLGQPLVVREQQTTSVTLMAVQPLTGLLPISQGHMATDHLQKAAELDRKAKSSDVAVQVVEAYFGALTAQRMEEVASTVVANLESHEARASAFHDAGLLQKNELLQIQVALANAKLGQRRASDGQELARGLLAVLIGADEETVVPNDIPEEAMLAPSAAFDGGTTGAARPDVAAMKHRVSAAEAGRRAKMFELGPEVAAIAAWQRNEGMGSFAAKEATYVGLTASWQLWGWGRKHWALREATATARQAKVGLQAMTDAVPIEVKRSWDSVLVSWQAYEVAQVTDEQATENHRIVAARFDSQLATATDLLDAESLLAQARMSRLTSRYDYLTSVARWQRATGAHVEPLKSQGVSP
jgi:outer membrane protein